VLGLPHTVRNDLIACIAEFCGTFMFLFMALGAAQANALVRQDSSLDSATLLFIAAAFGTALAVNVWATYRISGGMLNPAVTLGLVLIGSVNPIRGLLVVLCQLVAAIAAAALVSGLLPGPLNVTNSLGPDVKVVQGVFIEMFLTAQLVLVVYLLAVEKHRSTHLAPLGIGIAVFVCHMFGIPLTGTSVNPARSFGPAVVEGNFVSYHWIYWVGPFLGSLLACGLYKAVVFLGYHSANPGQDEDGLDHHRGQSLCTCPAGERMYAKGQV
jgi:aquaporin related protein